MKQVCILLLLALCACSPRKEAHKPIVTDERAKAALERAAAKGSIDVITITETFARFENSNDLWRVLSEQLRQREVDYLSTLPASELDRREATIRRGSSRSGFTLEDIADARKLKAERQDAKQRERTMKRLIDSVGN